MCNDIQRNNVQATENGAMLNHYFRTLHIKEPKICRVRSQLLWTFHFLDIVVKRGYCTNVYCPLSVQVLLASSIRQPVIAAYRDYRHSKDFHSLALDRNACRLFSAVLHI